MAGFTLPYLFHPDETVSSEISVLVFIGQLLFVADI